MMPMTLALLMLFPVAPKDAAADTTSPWSVLQLIQYQKTLHPSLSVRDVYGLLRTAWLGPGRPSEDSLAAEAALEKELDTLRPGATEASLLERASTDGNIVRVNLGPFKALNLSPRMLVQAVMESGRETVPDSLQFLREWNEFVSLVKYGLLSFPLQEVIAWDRRIGKGMTAEALTGADGIGSDVQEYRIVRLSVWKRLLASERKGGV